MRFYEAIAQVLPVLLLALAIESRVLRLWRPPPPPPEVRASGHRRAIYEYATWVGPATALLTACMLVLGEMRALAILGGADARAQDTESLYVTAGVALGIIAALALRPRTDEAD
ncbi:MAG TPA: hypothetical protein VIL49_18185 [Capillimicrobium sp.]|jgi:hypothetical protein